MYDVLVVGAGPAGSSLAGSLAANGHSIAVIEKQPQSGWKTACTGIVSQECRERFNIPNTSILRELSSASLFSPSGVVLNIARPETQAVMLDRTIFDASLARSAAGRGAEYFYNTAAVSFENNSDGITTHAISGGKPRSFTSRSIVLACGYNPSILQAAGLGTFSDFAMGVQAEIPGSLDRVNVFFGRDTAPDFFAWAAPSRPGYVRGGLLAREHSAVLLQSFIGRLRTEGKIDREKAEVSFGAIPLHSLKKTYGHRVLAVGDAAGQVKPVTGGGIYFGMLCAELAAQTLHSALQDDNLSSRRLAGYERAWRKSIGSELQTGYWARRIFQRLSDKRMDAIFNTMKSSGIDRAILENKELSFDRHGALALALVGNSILSRLMGGKRAGAHLTEKVK